MLNKTIKLFRNNFVSHVTTTNLLSTSNETWQRNDECFLTA